ncbi:MAG: hypothetical protein ACQERC_03070 [Bacteroidota bacterium]
MTRILIIILTIFFWSCNQNPENTKKDLETVEHEPQTPDTLEKKDLDWADQYVKWYLDQEDENLKTNDSLTLSFIKDHQIRQGRETVQIRIGYDLQHRFEVRKWLYIDFETHSMAEYNIENDSLTSWPNHDDFKSEIPKSGEYRYDIAFAEWQGKSMGEKVTVIIEGDSVKIRYEGDGNLSLSKKGDILDSGLLRKHVSGSWIIAESEMDIYTEEFGGCGSGPTIIDFKNKKYWTC